jgi:hypothetical protein
MSTRRQARPADEVPSITSAPEPLADDQSRRMSRYLIQMGIRVVCFLAAIFLAEGWLRWVLVVAAVVLPYSAVLFANAGRDRVAYDTSPLTPAGPAALPASPHVPDAAPAAGRGRVVEHRDDDGPGHGGPGHGDPGDDDPGDDEETR